MLVIQPNRRVAAGLAAVLLEALVLYALVLGLALTMPPGHDADLRLFNLAPPPPPPPPHRIEPQHLASHRPAAEAAPPNLRAHPTDIVLPKPVVPLPPPPPVNAAPVAGPGMQPSAGAAPVPGPGTGAGGVGNGLGGGGNGDGDGAGTGRFTPPRWLRGELRDSDYPRLVGESGQGGTVSVRFSVETDGRVGTCIVTRSSGNGDLDRTTCALIQQRYRYRPSLDPAGRPVRSQIVEDHTWVSLGEQERDRDR